LIYDIYLLSYKKRMDKLKRGMLLEDIENRNYRLKAKCGHYHQKARDYFQSTKCWDCDMNDIYACEEGIDPDTGEVIKELNNN